MGHNMPRSNPDAAAHAADVLANGGTVAQAAEAANVTRRTVARWAQRGRLELLNAPHARLAVETDRVPPPRPGPLSEADLVELLEQ
jgi:Helix-turn-helix domain